MKKTEALKTLKSMGTAQNRKVYARHGMTGDIYGVSYANFGKLKRQIKQDHDLALGLWASGNLDARVLATMICDPEKLSASELDAWVKGCDSRGLTGAISDVAAENKTAKARVKKWTSSRDEWTAVTGWYTISSIVKFDVDALSDADFEGYLKSIEKKIHSSKNWVRYAMNTALIAIGSRPSMTKKAIAAAKRIGKVEVDHGETGCKTPDAVPYIEKSVARNNARAKKAKKKAKRKAS